MIPAKIKKIFDGNKNVQQVSITYFDGSKIRYRRDLVNGEIKKTLVF